MWRVGEGGWEGVKQFSRKQTNDKDTSEGSFKFSSQTSKSWCIVV